MARNTDPKLPASHTMEFRFTPGPGSEALQRRAELQSLELDRLMAAVEAAFNPMWGPMFRDRDEQTRFADQIQQFACAYTGKVGNLYMVDSHSTLYAPVPALPHERLG